MLHPTRRRWFRATAALLVVITLGRIYTQIIPVGATPLPFLCSVTGVPITSADGSVSVKVIHNDAGAMHSGNHWTWIVAESPLFGKRVVAAGYVGPEIAVNGKPLEATSSEAIIRLVETLPHPDHWYSRNTVLLTMDCWGLRRWFDQ